MRDRPNNNVENCGVQCTPDAISSHQFIDQAEGSAVRHSLTMANLYGYGSTVLTFFILFNTLVCSTATVDLTRSTPPTAGQCFCVDGHLSEVRRFGCGRPLYRAISTAYRCFRFAGEVESCVHGGNALDVLSLEAGISRLIWMAGDRLTRADSSRCRDEEAASCPRIVTRAEWKARLPRSVQNITHPVPRLFVHHTDGPSCRNFSACCATVRSIQNFHMDDRGWDDIGYNFLVGEDGNVYEGRGWDRVGAQVRGYNTVSLGFSVMGNYDLRLPNTAALDALKSLITCTADKGEIAGNYTLHGHRDGECTDCPGQKLYELIVTWPHYGGHLPHLPCQWTPKRNSNVAGKRRL